MMRNDCAVLAAARVTARVTTPVLALAAAVLLAACGSVPQERFYSLSNGLGTAAAGAASAAQGAARTTLAAPAYYIEVPAVTVPKQAARNQLVVTTGDGRVDVLEQERWVSPPAAEIGQALSLAITGELGTVDVFRAPVPDKSPVYRISTNVQRFESAPGRYSLIDMVWSVRLAGSPQVLTCRSVAQETVGAGYDELVAGHRRAITRIGADISRAVRALAAGDKPAC
ncbi:PqiC family protein [Duganella sp. P38]|uniref:PqiC family protein n=1 Tax=Duganella sp. P38 TaxID=3423949 RepID=UPI003D799F47